MRGRIGAIAGVGFVVIGAVELALTGGPAPPRDAPRQEVVAFFTEEAAAGPAVAVLSAVAAALLLVFASVLRRRITDHTLGDTAWGAGIATVGLALAGQAVQQATWLAGDTLTPETITMLGGLVDFLFGFAVVAGGVMAAASGLAALTGSPLPRWLAVLAAIAVAVPLVGIANAAAAAAMFPAFLIWLLGASVALARQPADPTGTPEADAPPRRPA